MEKRKFDEIREAFEARLQELFVLCNGKTVVLWGYGYSGHFLDYAFQKRGKQIELRIDADGKKTGLERPCILAELNPETHIGLLSFPPSQDVIDQLERHGFRVGVSYIPLVAWFYEDEVRPLGFHDWLEHVAHVDIRKREGEVNAKVKDFNEFSKSHDFMLDKVLRNFVFRPGDRIFDYGCGKGSALVLFERIDVPWGGIEYDEGLYETCRRNLATLGLPTDTVVCGDAGAFTDIDDYNYFYCYNAFQGETFRRAVHQMEASWQRRPRKITFIYSNPFCHERVVEHGVFFRTKTIPADFYIPEVYVYQTKAK